MEPGTLNVHTRRRAMLILADSGWGSEDIAAAFGLDAVQVAVYINESRAPCEVWDMEISVRTANRITALGIQTVADLERRFDEFAASRGVGRKAIEEARVAIELFKRDRRIPRHA